MATIRRYGFLCRMAVLTPLIHGIALTTHPQQPPSPLRQSIGRQDSLLFDACFNTCDTARIGNLLAEDFEFYHDLTGATRGKTAFINDVRNGLCRLPYKARRAVEPASLEVHPLHARDSLYGAIQNGYHRFYASKDGKPEYFTGRARFTHLWKLEKGTWKLSRGLSYDHQTRVPPGEIPDLDDSARVVAWLQEAKVPALSIGIIGDGRLQQVKMYGALRQGRPAGQNALFNVASITKTMTTQLVLRLVSAGQWNLDEPLHNYWTDPDVAADPRSKLLTTRHVLNQQSGFPNWRREQDKGKLAFLAAPGTKYGYSGEGFEYLRHALERKFRRSLDQLADSLLFRPLGMKDTHYTWGAHTDSLRMATPHDAQGKPLDFERNLVPNAADLVTTTVSDLAVFLLSVMNGDGLTPAVADDMVRLTVETKPNRYTGLCWSVYAPVAPGEYALSHGGADAGMHSICFLLPRSKQGLILFTNSDNGPKLYAALLKACLGEKGQAIADIEMAPETGP